jgi:hypothetical protein
LRKKQNTLRPDPTAGRNGAMQSPDPTFPVCSMCGMPEPIGSYSDDRTVSFCLGSQAISHQFLKILASIDAEQKASMDGLRQGEVRQEDLGSGSPA